MFGPASLRLAARGIAQVRSQCPRPPPLIDGASQLTVGSSVPTRPDGSLASSARCALRSHRSISASCDPWAAHRSPRSRRRSSTNSAVIASGRFRISWASIASRRSDWANYPASRIPDSDRHSSAPTLETSWSIVIAPGAPSHRRPGYPAGTRGPHESASPRLVSKPGLANATR
jgi:hypothetical protein